MKGEKEEEKNEDAAKFTLSVYYLAMALHTFSKRYGVVSGSRFSAC